MDGLESLTVVVVDRFVGLLACLLTLLNVCMFTKVELKPCSFA